VNVVRNNAQAGAQDTLQCWEEDVHDLAAFELAQPLVMKGPHETAFRAP
jgi:hypothetical protein